MCIAGGCYLVNYAETGSRHRPFTTGELFGGLTKASRAERIGRASDALPKLLRRLVEKLASVEKICECDQIMAGQIREGHIPEDWHKWFD